MVSFQCNGCNDTLKKPKLDQHAQRCRNASFSCLDCSTDFKGTEYRSHTSCISEAEKYEKTVYKGPKNKNQQQQKNQKNQFPKALPPHLDLPSSSTSTLTTADSSSSSQPTNGTTNGSTMHPDRQKSLGLTAAPAAKATPNATKKRSREEDIAVEQAAEEGSASAGASNGNGEGSPKKKKSKKDKSGKEKEKEVESVVDVAETTMADEAAAKEAAPEVPETSGKKAKKDKKKKEKAVAGADEPAAPTAVDSTEKKDDESTSEDAIPAPTIHAYLNELLPTLLTTSQSLSSLLTSVVASASTKGFTDAAEVQKVLFDGVWVGGDKPKKMLLLNFEKKERKRGMKKLKEEEREKDKDTKGKGKEAAPVSA